MAGPAAPAAKVPTLLTAPQPAARTSYSSFRGAIPDGQKTGATPAYVKAVQTVFRQQGQAQKAAILQGAKANPNLPSSKVVLSLFSQQTHTATVKAQKSGNVWGDITGALSRSVGNTGSVDAMLGRKGPNNGPAWLQPAVAAAQPVAPKTVATLLKNTGKDAIDLPAAVESSIAVPVSDALKGDWGAAAKSFTQPWEYAFSSPTNFGKFVYGHPLDAYLMASGALHPIERVAEGAVRTATRSGPADLARPAVHVTANMNVERPDFATTPHIRGIQRIREDAKFTKNPDGTVNATGRNAKQVEARLIKLRVAHLVNQGELVRRSDRNTQIGEHMASVLKNRAGRAAHSIKTALTYNPNAPTIPGAEVLSRIAEGVVRKPSTVVADLEKHLQQVSANRPDLLDNPENLAQHDKYVKTIRGALNDKAFTDNPEPAFKAAVAYRKAMGPLERDARRNGHFKDMTPEALQRRAAMPAVLTHMPGARYDDELGMVRDTPTGTHKLSTSEMRQFVRDQTGRDPAYVSHGQDPGDKAFYVPQSRRPSTAPEHTTLWNFRHGLTDPSHEAMLKHRVQLQGVVSAHRQLNRVAGETEVVGNDGKGWDTFKAASAAAPKGYVPIRRVSFGYPTSSLQQALHGVDLATIDEEAQHRSLDYTSRLKDDGSKGPGAWALTDGRVANELKAHEKNFEPDTTMRAIRGGTNQFRTVALATSFKHVPGVAQELLIRSAASGVGPVSYFAGKQVLRAAKEIDPRLAREREVQLKGGLNTGQALRMQTHGVARHYEGTILHGPLAAWEKAVKAPGPRQASNLWHAWGNFMLGGTKRMLEEQAQTAAIGRHTINDFGGRHGLVALATNQWGHMIDQAAHGVLDERGLQRFNNTSEKIYGRWTSLTPGEQKALMFSPFGMWWVNSAKWLTQLPTDHPMLTGALADLNAGTQKQRAKQGLDMFAPGALPSYLQGGIPLGGGKIMESNYYSPFGIANDPLSTAASLTVPWETPVAQAAIGVDWKGSKINSPGNPGGYGTPSKGQELTVILNSLAGSFIPLYQKAQTIVQGGGSSYDTSTLLAPQTKGKNPGPLAGLKSATFPVRIGKVPGYAGPPGKATGTSLPSLPSVNLPSLPSLPSMP